MVGGTTHQQPQASQLAPPPSSSSTAPPVATEEEEFLKRNTDCVYFLASPLTCKKGSECEYRHSDIARVNPRDCWYWLNGNCLNPKCAFRHPPLDGLLGAEVAPQVGPTLPQPPATPMSKQGVPCIFFQKGFCLKGHLCPFSHGPTTITTTTNKTIPPVPSNNTTKPSKPPSEKPIQEQKLAQQETPKIFPPKIKQNQTPARNGGSSGGSGGGWTEKKVAAVVPEEARYRPANVVAPPVAVNRSNHVSDTEGINGKEVEEYSREPTPGFDVLVDNEHQDSEYYQNEEQFGRSNSRSRGQDFDFDVDQEMYREHREEGYPWEESLSGAHNYGRKRYPRDESPDQFDRSDLRHRISNQRRGSFGINNNNNNNNNNNVLRSVISREHPRDDRMVRRDRHHDRHGPLSGRLRGRIQMPGGNENEIRVEREFDMSRYNRSRYSPRPPHGRFRDRINEGRDFRGPRDIEYTKRSQRDDGQSQSQSQSQPFGKRKFGQQSEENNLSFEGPKPLSEILKRKRGESVNNDDINNNVKENNGNENENEKKEVFQPRSVVNVNNEENSLNDEDALLDEELEAYDDHKDGDYDYEQIDGEEEYNLEEGEEYMEEEEGGKKESEVYS